MTDPLALARQLLADGTPPPEAVARLTPATKPEAVHLARRLPVLAEESDQAGAVTRLATRIGMRKYRLFFTPDGRVADDPAYNRPHPHPRTRELPGGGCTVTYTAGYCGDRDHFQLLGPPADEPDRFGIVPREPIPMSETGYWSHFAHPDAIAALGGPEAYLAALQAAGRDGREEFERALTGEGIEPKKPGTAVVGKHTAHTARPEPPPVEPPVGETGEPEEQRAEPPKADEDDGKPSLLRGKVRPTGGQASLF